MMSKRETERDHVSCVNDGSVFLRPLMFRLTVQFLTDVRKRFGPVHFPQIGPG